MIFRSSVTSDCSLVCRSNVLVGDSSASQRGQQGRTGNAATGERVENGYEQDDNSAGTQNDSGQLRNGEELKDTISEVIEISSAERTEMETRIVDWLSEDNLSRAAGKTREEIFDEFGNELMPIAYIPTPFLCRINTGRRKRKGCFAYGKKINRRRAALPPSVIQPKLHPQ